MRIKNGNEGTKYEISVYKCIRKLRVVCDISQGFDCANMRSREGFKD